MKLKIWQTINKVSNRVLAEAIKVHTSYITHIRNGRKTPSLPIAVLISDYTGVAVTVNDLNVKAKGQGAQ